MENKCTKTTNNFFFNCPPKTADGRLFTNYEDHRDYHMKIKSQLNVDNQVDFRNKLQTNRDSYLNISSNKLEQNVCYNGDIDIPKPSHIARVTAKGTVFIPTNIPGGIGVINEEQWNNINLMKPRFSPITSKCRPASYEYYANSEAIKQINRNYTIYAGNPFGLYIQNNQ